jgi:hypothetical protein
MPVGSTCFITSNRDEKQIRKPAQAPQAYTHNASQITYPKDADAGGTWIAVKDNGDAAVLLNGAFKKHIAVPPYSKSRGLIFLDIFSGEVPFNAFCQISLQNIEPFTLVLFTGGNLQECRWDGNRKYSKALDSGIPHIWSSCTLYDEEVIKRRVLWFSHWLAENPCPCQWDIIDFHRFGGEGDTHNDLRMNRDGMMLTVSITSIALREDAAVMQYLDLQNGQCYSNQTSVLSNLAII